MQPYGLHRTFRKTGQGVCLSGEDNPLQKEYPKRKRSFAASFWKRGSEYENASVTWARPETGRTNPGQGEVPVEGMEA